MRIRNWVAIINLVCYQIDFAIKAMLRRSKMTVAMAKLNLLLRLLILAQGEKVDNLHH